MRKLDDFDVALLRCLQDDNRMTSEAIAEQVGLSPTACQRRMKKLRQSGAIAGDVSIVDPEHVGGRMVMIVQVVLARGQADIVDAFKRDARRTPEIQQCYYVTGEADFVLVVTAKDMADYERLTRRIFFDNPNIQKFQTMVAMETVKAGLKISL
ncbi:MAG: Lrp/AsnC family transcriptional regulator [Methyloligellaceae bacterium]